ncbi:MAG: pyroglutamyl-peptidase I [Defluviitaleaceae bacterium]|nr:pyroglutamyl-peptidase I [Defluviitaleaceae bacterium]
MKKVLITAFDPFGGEPVNPALEAVMRLPDEIDGVTIIKKEIPTVFGKSAEILCQALEQEKPDAVISVGQAGGRTHISIERVAINIDDARIPDNEGNQPIDMPIVEGGPTAYFATLPVKAIIRDLIDAGIPTAISETAGTFVCNHLMYAALHYAAEKQPDLKAGFIHIPYLPEQTLDKAKMPSMSADSVADSLKVMVRTLKNS